VISAGQAHGAQYEDIYGCLYFYLSDQLRTFAERVRRFRITFYLLDSHCSGTGLDIRAGLLEQLGIPKTIRFDRIDVSSVITQNVSEVLTAWAPLLSDVNPYSTLIGHFLDWDGGRGPPISSLDEVMGRLYQEEAVRRWLTST